MMKKPNMTEKLIILLSFQKGDVRSAEHLMSRSMPFATEAQGLCMCRQDLGGYGLTDSCGRGLVRGCPAHRLPEPAGACR
jgi:hypothetical protein